MRANPRHDYVFHTTCVGSTGELINEMQQLASDVSYETLRDHCEGLLDVARELGYGRDIGLHLSRDWHVSFHKSRYAEQPCYYFVWSGIEHIWLKRDCDWDEVRRREEGTRHPSNSLLPPRFNPVVQFSPEDWQRPYTGRFDPHHIVHLQHMAILDNFYSSESDPPNVELVADWLVSGSENGPTPQWHADMLQRLVDAGMTFSNKEGAYVKEMVETWTVEAETNFTEQLEEAVQLLTPRAPLPPPQPPWGETTVEIVARCWRIRAVTRAAATLDLKVDCLVYPSMLFFYASEPARQTVDDVTVTAPQTVRFIPARSFARRLREKCRGLWQWLLERTLVTSLASTFRAYVSRSIHRDDLLSRVRYHTGDRTGDTMPSTVPGEMSPDDVVVWWRWMRALEAQLVEAEEGPMRPARVDEWGRYRGER